MRVLRAVLLGGFSLSRTLPTLYFASRCRRGSSAFAVPSWLRHVDESMTVSVFRAWGARSSGQPTRSAAQSSAARLKAPPSPAQPPLCSSAAYPQRGATSVLLRRSLPAARRDLRLAPPCCDTRYPSLLHEPASGEIRRTHPSPPSSFGPYGSRQKDRRRRLCATRAFLRARVVSSSIERGEVSVSAFGRRMREDAFRSGAGSAPTFPWLRSGAAAAASRF